MLSLVWWASNSGTVSALLGDVLGIGIVVLLPSLPYGGALEDDAFYCKSSKRSRHGYGRLCAVIEETMQQAEPAHQASIKETTTGNAIQSRSFLESGSTLSTRERELLMRSPELGWYVVAHGTHPTGGRLSMLCGWQVRMRHSSSMGASRDKTLGVSTAEHNSDLTKPNTIRMLSLRSFESKLWPWDCNLFLSKARNG